MRVYVTGLNFMLYYIHDTPHIYINKRYGYFFWLQVILLFIPNFKAINIKYQKTKIPIFFFY